MKTLIYTVGYGDLYYRLACMMAHTARIHGYTDDILIFATQDKPSPYATVLNVETHPKGDLLKTGRDITFHNYVPASLGYEVNKAPYDYFLPKMILPEFVDLASYDRVMYLDSDILIPRPLDPVIWSHPGIVGGYTEHSSFKAMRKLRRMLSTEERIKAITHPTVGSACICIPREHYGFFKEYEDVYRKTISYVPHDAAAFVYTLYTKWDLYNPLMLPRSQFHHFWGSGGKKARMVQIYKNLAIADKELIPR